VVAVEVRAAGALDGDTDAAVPPRRLEGDAEDACGISIGRRPRQRRADHRRDLAVGNRAGRDERDERGGDGGPHATSMRALPVRAGYVIVRLDKLVSK
jgi:hypothetical protein